MDNLPTLDDVHAGLAATIDTTLRVETLAVLADRPGLAYATANVTRTVYLVTYYGKLIGELRHQPNDGAISGWRARPIGEGAREIGPYRTARQAAAALLKRN